MSFAKGCLIAFVGLLAITLILAISGWSYWAGTYSALNVGSKEVDEKAANVDVVLVRQHELIPNLVETVKGYAKHEQMFVDIAKARSQAGSIKVTDAMNDPEKMKALANAQGELSGLLTRLLAVSENYPNLKADARFGDLQSQLEGSANRISEARQRYNKSVREYNTTVEGLVSQLVAKVHGFKRREMFEADAASKVTPKVDFSNSGKG